jgi:hypothetical protein
MIKLYKKSEWFEFDSPLGEPNEDWTNQGKYLCERIVNKDGITIWFGININWKKEPDYGWEVLTENPDAKPLEKYLPEIVYGEDRTYWKDCEMPIYEKLYLELQNKNNESTKP